MIDTHTHLYMENFTAEAPDGDAQAVDRALEAGVECMILPCVDRESASQVAELHCKRPGCTLTAMGLHPTEAGDDWREELDDILEILRPTKPVAIGETGIDLYWSDNNIEHQKDSFIAQLLLGAEENLPVIIHCREAVDQCCECILKAQSLREGQPLSPLIFHSFTGSPEDVRKIRSVCDPYFGINGVVTFKNSGSVPSSVREIGIGRLLLETDSPYLSPVPKRGRRNESANLPYINEKIAFELGLTPESTAEATTRNAKEVFKIWR